MSNRLFLTPDEMAELSGIKVGRQGLSRDQRQVNWLRTSGIPFVINAAGRPIVTIVAIEGRTLKEQPKSNWAPRVIQRTA